MSLWPLHAIRKLALAAISLVRTLHCGKPVLQQISQGIYALWPFKHESTLQSDALNRNLQSFLSRKQSERVHVLHMPRGFLRVLYNCSFLHT
jgi:hypothetical protein